jgi:hypothetical protein
VKGGQVKKIVAILLICILIFVITGSFILFLFGSRSFDFSSYEPVAQPFQLTFPFSHVKRFIQPNDPLVQGALKDIYQNKLFFGSDLRAIRNWVATNIEFKSDLEKSWLNCLLRNLNPFEYWQYPQETIKSKSGDCEDFAILLCSLLRASGYSSEEVFVALGKKGITGHAFVVIKEGEEYRTIEPQARQILLGFSAWFVDHQLNNLEIEYLFNDRYFYKYQSRGRNSEEMPFFNFVAKKSPS